MDQRTYPRSRVVAPADRARGEKIAGTAAQLTREMAALRAKQKVLSRRRDVAWAKANALGVSRYQLAKIAGVQRHVVDVALTRARDNA